jgi:hypothetical protein
MTFMGLDLNSSRVRAMCGVANLSRPVLLDDGERDLPLAVSLERRRAEAGRAGVQLCRQLPHLACLDFLAHLGTPREWKAGRHRLDAGRALTLVLEKLHPFCAGVQGVALTLPAYLTRTQAGLLATLLAKVRIPLLGSVTAPLAAVWTAHQQEPWRGLAVVLDADDHALTCTAVAADESGGSRQARVLVEQVMPALGVRAWKERLLDGIADRCIRQSRRDPRDSAVAEQALYDQLDEACAACRQGQTLEFGIQAEHWYQNLRLPPQEFVTFCAPLVRRTLEVIHRVLEAVQAEEPPAVILVSAAASRLPGLTAMLCEQTGEGTAVTVLSADAAAKAAHELAGRWQSGALPSGHVDVAVPLGRRSLDSYVQAAKSALRNGHTKLPVRGPKLAQPDDDFSVTIDD